MVDQNLEMQKQLATNVFHNCIQYGLTVGMKGAEQLDPEGQRMLVDLLENKAPQLYQKLVEDYSSPQP